MPLPLTFLRTLPSDTSAWVKQRYQIDYVRRNQGQVTVVTDGWERVVISGFGQEVLNPALFLNKFCPDKALLKAADRNESKARTALFYEAWKKIADKQPADYASAVLERRHSLMSDLGKPSGTLDAEVVWRMIIGLGNPHPLETSLTLHPQYGFPQIPSSAIKGLTRHGRLCQIGEEIGVFRLPEEELRKRWKAGQKTPLERLETLLLMRPEEEETVACLHALQTDAFVQQAIQEASPPMPITQLTVSDMAARYGEDFRRAFGTGQKQGEIDFLEATPHPGWTYELDVMTPHYGDYYSDATKQNVAPADWLNLNPITFLTVGKGSRFRFDVSGKDSLLLSKVTDWLKMALSEQGVGSKTNAGYGEMM